MNRARRIFILTGAALLGIWILEHYTDMPWEENSLSKNGTCRLELTFMGDCPYEKGARTIYFGYHGGFATDYDDFTFKWRQHTEMDLSPDAPNPLPAGFKITLTMERFNGHDVIKLIQKPDWILDIRFILIEGRGNIKEGLNSYFESEWLEPL